MPTYWIETLGCPKNLVDSAKLEGHVERSGLVAAEEPESADLVIVNTCAFIESARAESIQVVLELAERRKHDARLVVTGCMAERYREELELALPRVAAARQAVLVDPTGWGRTSEVVPAHLDALRAVLATAERRAVGVREGCRGLRPTVRLLCDPDVPRRPAVPHHRRPRL